MRPAVLLSCLALAACVPEIKTRRTTPDYPLVNFRGPGGIPEAPADTVGGQDLRGYWRVVSAEIADGNTSEDNLLRPGTFLRIDDQRVGTYEGVPPEMLLPPELGWHVNLNDAGGVLFGFGWESAREQGGFVHYGFALAGTRDPDHASAVEAAHVAPADSDIVQWQLWNVELERVRLPNDLPPGTPQLPGWLNTAR